MHTCLLDNVVNAIIITHTTLNRKYVLIQKVRRKNRLRLPVHKRKYDTSIPVVQINLSFEGKLSREFSPPEGRDFRDFSKSGDFSYVQQK